MPRTVLLATLAFLAVAIAALASYHVPIIAPPPKPRPVRPALTSDASAVAGPPKVKLAVLVVFDQMRGDYLPRWKQYFPPGGFRRLMDDGCWFSQCHYPYATTTTGPGHSAILSGATLDKTGIIENDWYDRTAAARVNCISGERFETVGNSGLAAAKGTKRSRNQPSSGSPLRMLAPTLGDQLKAAGRGKVIGISWKDRAAILPAGQQADAAYWFGHEFVTSTYYTDVLPGWVRKFNDGKLADSWYGKTWERLRPDLDYTALIGPDNGPGEASRYGLGVEFPHPITGGKPTRTGDYYSALVTSPYGNDLVLAFAKACIDAEKLGQRDAADLLTISFSSNDSVGHAFGPDSQEVFDVTLRSDRIMAELLAFLDDRVGKGNYTLAVTADHGICPLPEASRARGRIAGRINPGTLRADMEKALSEVYGKPIGSGGWIEDFPEPWVYLNYRQIAERKLSRTQVIATLADWLRRHYSKSIQRVYTAREIKEMPATDAIDRLVKASAHPDRSGDLYLVQHAYYLFSDPLATGTTHGSPFDYDRHVPLVVYGPHLPKGEQTEPASPLQAAAILADALGVKPPRDAVERPQVMRR